ncbi:cephalotocin receptor 1-like [Mytilus edulis]|uniref:cephalotocin receptor 1-like n=1 Tax=Mytilus edulis TaxID=6550 RepID=UPI0039EE8EEA
MNTSYSEISEDIKHRAYKLYWNEQNTDYLTPNSVLLSIFLLIGVPGNLAVIFVYQFRLKKKTDGRYFIVPLAWTDTVALLITGAFNLTQNIKSVMFPGFGSCKLLIYLSYVSTCISLYLLGAIAIQRYLKICRPFGRQLNLVWKRRCVFLCALASLVLYIPVLFHYGLVETRNSHLGNITGHQCSELSGSSSKLKWLKIFQGIGVFGTFCDVITITILYVLITRTIIKQTRKMIIVKSNVSNSCRTSGATGGTYTPKLLESAASETETSMSMDSSTQVSKSRGIQPTQPDPRKSAYRISFMFMTISIVGFLAYLPSWTLVMIETSNLEFWKKLSPATFHICLVLRRMYMVNHLCNPFIYGVFDKAFKEEMRKLFGKKR